MLKDKIKKVLDEVWHRGLGCGGLAPYNPIKEKKARTQALTRILELVEKEKELKVLLGKLKDIDWDCFYRGTFYGCYYYSDSGNIESQEYIDKTLLGALNKMVEDIDLPSPKSNGG